MFHKVEARLVADLIDRRDPVEEDLVAMKLAADIGCREDFDSCPDDAVDAGVTAAIEVIDEKTFEKAFDVLQSAVAEEVERQSQRIALRMLRELASKAPKEESVAG